MARPLGSKNNPNRKPLPFKHREIARAVRSVQSTGLPIAGVEVDPRTGKITVMTGPTTPGDNNKNRNPWDEVLTDAAHEKRIA
jgi:hypothetical protein